MSVRRKLLHLPLSFVAGLLAVLLVQGCMQTLVAAESDAAAAVQTQDFNSWMADLKAEARSKGVSDNTLDLAFVDVTGPIERVLELDRSQPEFTQTFSGYMKTRMSQARIDRGQQLLQEHSALFARIQQEYGVQPQYLVSFWALESNFGDFTGGFSVVNALSTLAYDPRRADFFRAELLTALRIIEAGHIDAARMTGSWAGAMGQCQFMPSTFMTYAKDGDGDGKIDIWGSVADVMTSAANYLSQSGWKGDERWGREIVLPQDFDFALSGTDVKKTVTEWNQLGIKRVDGAALGSADLQASVIVPAGIKGPAFLAYNNFRTTMVWNRSTFYAISVGHLADRFSGGPDIQYMPATEERALARSDVMEMQELLNKLGHDVGTPDGVLGSRTRQGVREFQLGNAIPADGYASYEMLTALRIVAGISL
jgi:membrane-bound lytic murein transglycosylase B